MEVREANLLSKEFQKAVFISELILQMSLTIELLVYFVALL